MNEHDDLGSGDDLGLGNDVLRETIGALVDGATPRGLPTAPEQNLGSLRRRVRTWRIAKAGAVGLGTAAVVGALAFSGAQANAWNRSEPLPGRPTVHASDLGPVPSEIPTSRRSPKPSISPTPSVSPSPSASPSDVPVVEPVPEASGSPVATEPEPDGTVSEEPEAPEVAWPPFEGFDEGYLPWRHESIACGMPVADLPAGPVRFTLEPNDSPSDLWVTSGFTIKEVAGKSYTLYNGLPPGYLLFQEGRLVGSSYAWSEGDFWDDTGEVGEGGVRQETTSPGQTWQVGDHGSLGIDELSTCGERVIREDWLDRPEFFTPVPAGRYDVVYAAPYMVAGDRSWQYVFTAPYPVTLP